MCSAECTAASEQTNESESNRAPERWGAGFKWKCRNDGSCSKNVSEKLLCEDEEGNNIRDGRG